MNRAIALLTVALFVSPVAFAAPTVVSSGNSGCKVTGHDSRIRGHDNALVFERERKVVAVIQSDYSLQVDGKPVPLTPEQQFAVASYRGGYDALMLEAKELGLAGASLGVQALLNVVGALFTGRMSEYEAEIEARAATLTSRGETVCAIAYSLQEQHDALVASIPEFNRAFAH